MIHRPIRVLIVCSGNSGDIAPFILEQMEALRNRGIEIFRFLIEGKGVVGYLRNYSPLFKMIKMLRPDIIHAHYGFSGFLAALQTKVPVVITLHGSDVNIKRNSHISRLAYLLANHTIFVSGRMAEKIRPKKHYSIVPCGIPLDKFFPIEKGYAREQMGLKKNIKYILFSSSFDRPEKNALLAKGVVLHLSPNIELIELKEYSRSEVNLLLNSVDMALMTSVSEGSPQFIKEAMACNCPIVSTDVGDVHQIISGVNGTYISTSEPNDVAEKIKHALDFAQNNGRTNGRQRIKDLGLDLDSIALRLLSVYNEIVFTKNKRYYKQNSRYS